MSLVKANGKDQKKKKHTSDFIVSLASVHQREKKTLFRIVDCQILGILDVAFSVHCIVKGAKKWLFNILLLSIIAKYIQLYDAVLLAS